MVSEAVALFIPLLLAVVTALCSFLRDSVSLRSTVQEQRASFPFLFVFLPPLGRFPIIHLSNISLLLLGIVIVKDVATSDLAAIIGSLILGIFSLILPILEIDEYGQVLNQRGTGWFQPKSYYYHCISMIFLSLSFFGFVELQVLILNFLLSRGFSVGGALLWFVNRILEIMLLPSLGIGLLFLYLSMAALSDEIKQSI
ncbi:hypothetical protein [Halonotius sp. GCM10025705]|uniref:hypothetical protein n=1 Tax=Halonotius sp. GCM10025705 TaxID=3252678 RepID=UPI00361A40AF